MRAIFVILLAIWNSVSATSNKNITEILPTLIKCIQPLPFNKYCIKDSITSMRPYLSDGVPQLNIPSFNTYMINKTEFNLTEQFEGIIKFMDIEITGLSDYTISDVCNEQVNATTYQMQFDAFFPRISISTKYRLHGKLLTEEIVRCECGVLALYKNLRANIIIIGEYYSQSDSGPEYYQVNEVGEYYRVNRVLITSNIGQIVTEYKDRYLQDIYEIEEIYQRDKWEKITPEVQLKIHEVASELIKTTANKIFSNFPISMLMSDQSTLC